MGEGHVQNIEKAVDFIEQNLSEKLDLNTVASAVHYSKYHLHRMFLDVLGMTLHDYRQRRQLTEAARLLTFTRRPVLDIALGCGYESQQSFTSAFKAMYKLPPAEFRERSEFYPLQLRYTLCSGPGSRRFTPEEIVFATKEDADDWMALLELVVDGFPHLSRQQFRQSLDSSIESRQALLLRDRGILAGAMIFSRLEGSIDFLAVHPQYRSLGIEQLFISVLRRDILPGREITTTTYRSADRADTGYRKLLKGMGFLEGELLTEFGYPTQRFRLPPEQKEG